MKRGRMKRFLKRVERDAFAKCGIGNHKQLCALKISVNTTNKSSVNKHTLSGIHKSVVFMKLR